MPLLRGILVRALLLALLAQVTGQPAALMQAASEAQAQYANPPAGSWPPCTDADKAAVERASEYVVGLLNLRQVALYPTTLERVVAAYKAPSTTLNGLPIAQRYWLAMQVTQRGDGFVLCMETYQDSLRNWQTVLPSPTKNFKTAGRPLLHDLDTEVWFARFLDEKVVTSCLRAARLVLEQSFFPLEIPGVRMVLSRLVHAETREDASGPTAVRALEAEAAFLEGRISELDDLRAQHARTLARALSAKREALRRASQRAREGEEEPLGGLDALRDEIDEGERALEVAEAEKQEAEARLRRTQEGLRQAQGAGAGGLSAPTHVFLVLDFVDEASLLLDPVPVPNPTLHRRQAVLFSQDWRRFGTTGWVMVQHHPFDLAAALAATPGYVPPTLQL